jgi:hypothetical protein
MAARKFFKNSGGILTEESAVVTSAGAADDGKIPALDANGRLDTTVMPTGIGADTAAVATSESLAAGDLVNIYDVTGTATVRKADAATSGKPAHGYVISAFTHPTTATVYFEGNNGAVTGRTPGTQFLATTAGATTTTAPSGSGNLVQQVGFATSATNVNFQAGTPFVLA